MVVPDSAHGSSKGGTIIATGDRIVMDMLNITNSHVNGPTYTGTNTIQGGAIFLTGNECNITNSRFENCFADHSKVEASGGALYILGNPASAMWKFPMHHLKKMVQLFMYLVTTAIWKRSPLAIPNLQAVMEPS